MDANERRERTIREAAEWWQALEAGELSRTERERYVDWLRESAVHVAEMLRIARVHGALAQFERWTNLATVGTGEDVVVAFPQNLEPDVIATRQATTIGPASVAQASADGRWMKVLAVAAALSGVAIIASWLWLVGRGQVIETVRGERREVALADGSVVQVDPETTLTVELGEEQRQVTLERGRALFRVAKDPERPFLVRADGTVVRAVGTAFGVEQREQGVTVTVAEGKVAVLQPAGPSRQWRPSRAENPTPARSQEADAARQARGSTSESAKPAEATGGSGGIFLVANEQLTVPRSGSVATVRKVDSTKELAWAEGRLVFEDDTVVEVIRNFNRYNLVQLQVSDEALASRTVSGVFDASDPESFIAFMQTVAEIKVVRGKGQEITIASQ